MSGRRDGLLDALCWCRATYVTVTPDAVRAGLTGSCGGDYCNPPGTPARRTIWAYLDAPPTVTPGGPRGHGPKDRAQPTDRDRERTLRRLAGPPIEEAS